MLNLPIWAVIFYILAKTLLALMDAYLVSIIYHSEVMQVAEMSGEKMEWLSPVTQSRGCARKTTRNQSYESGYHCM